jgi:rRNA-processing protein FCF1
MELLIVVLLLVVAAEVTYLTTKQTTKSIKNNTRPIFVDTSVLIDGRIIAVARSGFITDTLVIPRSVIGELQFLADNGDHDKRSRARYGLDVAQELQALDAVKVEILQDGSRPADGVDNQLLHLAKQYGGAICTIDYNLNKVANVEGIVVLNVNDLAMSLRMAYLPGERMMLEITQKGNEQHQGVGHLSDGTMVVVEQASSLVGKRVEIEFIRSLQTAAGKMMFARTTAARHAGGVSSKQSSGEPAEGMFAKQDGKNSNASKFTKRQRNTNKTNEFEPKKQEPKPEQSLNNNRQRQSRRQDQPQQQKQPQPQRPNQPRHNNNQRRRVDHEDNLIELVNNQ